jgi:paraquat-inducible protein B
MSKKANPTVIGAFIVGAIAIMTTLILLLSGNLLFKESEQVIMYFDGSVTGLNIGAPVKFRGVEIGSVKDIKLILDDELRTTEVPVIAEIYRDSYLIRLGDETVRASEILEDTYDFVEDGLRAQLKVKSLLTGQLFIELEFFPDSSYTLHGNGEIEEIPTKPTAIQEITKTLEKYPVNKVLNNIASTMASLDKIFSDPVILETLNSINQASQDYSVLANNLVTETKTISADLHKTLENSNKILESAEVSFRKVDKTLMAAEQMLNTSSGVLQEDSPLMYSLVDALNELANAARSVRDLADTLEQQPEALLRGKSAGGN